MRATDRCTNGRKPARGDNLTGSALDLGPVGLAHFGAQITFSLPAGHVADRHDRRTVVLLCRLPWLVRRPIERGVGRVMFASVAVFGAATIVYGMSE